MGVADQGRDATAEAAAKYSRSSSASAADKKAGKREGKREGKRRVIGGGGPTFEERQALEREYATEGSNQERST